MRTIHVSALATAALLLAAACGDVTGAGAGARANAPEPAKVLLGTITCHVDVVRQTSRCGDLVAPGGPSANRFILDSAYWTLETGAQFNSGGLAYFFNEIQNDLGQEIGIENGVPDTTFAFITSITTTGGSGTVTPANHDGMRGFTAPSQAYWAYDGEVSPGDDTFTKIWTFNLPATVTSWTYTIGVQTTVMHPNGWIEVSGDTQVPNGGSRQHTALVRDWTGTTVTSGSVLWSTSSVGGSVTTTTNNSRQATFAGTGVGYVEVTASLGTFKPDVYAIEVY
ncbi:hypothetical protein [Longimicrobium sp.]|uniref:hypothetical protein n=1 Tax=Longimicrobium sp. TaxID=2029185 RepID=UPI002E35ED4E|nr:hypothetical protein [Longimicrobium sp.]HEX6038964.1 hypothetical protein [Longimicrobium sp.]